MTPSFSLTYFKYSIFVSGSNAFSWRALYIHICFSSSFFNHLFFCCYRVMLAQTHDLSLAQISRLLTLSNWHTDPHIRCALRADEDGLTRTELNYVTRVNPAVVLTYITKDVKMTTKNQCQNLEIVINKCRSVLQMSGHNSLCISM